MSRLFEKSGSVSAWDGTAGFASQAIELLNLLRKIVARNEKGREQGPPSNSKVL